MAINTVSTNIVITIAIVTSCCCYLSKGHIHLTQGQIVHDLTLIT